MRNKIVYVMVVIIILLSGFSIILYYYLSSEDKYQDNNIIKTNAYIVTDLTNGNAPLRVNFKSLVQNFRENVQYYWDFGDGEQSYESNPTHIYITEGSYNCMLIVKDDWSESSDDILITVRENNPPIVNILVDKTSGNVPLTVNFDVDGFDIDGEIVSYDWEIKYPFFVTYQKISNYQEKNFSERFSRIGFYEVKLTVTDNTGDVATDYIKIHVQKAKIGLILEAISFVRDFFKDNFKR